MFPWKNKIPGNSSGQLQCFAPAPLVFPSLPYFLFQKSPAQRASAPPPDTPGSQATEPSRLPCKQFQTIPFIKPKGDHYKRNDRRLTLQKRIILLIQQTVSLVEVVNRKWNLQNLLKNGLKVFFFYISEYYGGTNTSVTSNAFASPFPPYSALRLH